MVMIMVMMMIIIISLVTFRHVNQMKAQHQLRACFQIVDCGCGRGQTEPKCQGTAFWQLVILKCNSGLFG